ncbi:MAG TPA: hypothetical protein VJO33_05105 [Gemmatimonadaceae bacterium]|nr:hypothetical protein [Gemmatimonadaceae bacterium]
MTPAEEAAILDEQVAANQRVITEAEEQPGVSDLVLRARAKVREQEEYAAQCEREQRERQRQYEREALVRAVAAVLGLRIEDVTLHIEDLKYAERVTGEVVIEGLTFRRGHGSQDSLILKRTCSRCGEASWRPIYSLTYLADLSETYDHQHECVPEPEPDPTPEPDQSWEEEREDQWREAEREKQLQAAAYVSPFQIYQQAAEKYQQTVKLRRELQFQRPVEKAAAVKRILEAKLATSATGAKEMTHEDPDFAQFCQTLTDAVIAEMEARESYFVARKNAGISGGSAPAGDGDDEEAA